MQSHDYFYGGTGLVNFHNREVASSLHNCLGFELRDYDDRGPNKVRMEYIEMGSAGSNPTL